MIRALLVPLLAITLLPHDAFAQQSGIIEGWVKDRDGNPVTGLIVVAKSPTFRREATTGADGKYNLGLPAGTYEVSAGTDCNQSMFYQKDVKISDGITTLNIKLNILYGILGLQVSIHQLIANPEKYHNRRVLVHGFLHVKFEDSGLYSSRDDADYLISENALWISYSLDKLKLEPNSPTLKPNQLDYFDGKHVFVVGIFNKNECGHMGAYGGNINIERLVELKRYYDGRKALK